MIDQSGVRVRDEIEIAFVADEAATIPVFAQLARTVVNEILRGRLAPGQRLPSSRRLAAQWAVHRNTVLSALDELAAEGWVETRAGAGCWVSTTLPERPPPRGGARGGAPASGFASGPGFAMGEPLWQALATMPPSRPGAYFMAGGQPDLRLLPREMLSRAWRRAVRDAGSKVLSYGDPRGALRLRRAVASWCAARRDLAVGAREVMITRGSQGALDLLSRAFLRPGEHVAVEALGYGPAWVSLRAAGATLWPVAVDDQGLDVEALEALARKRTLRAVYVTPHHQYPTMVTLSASRRLRLLDLARRYGLLVIEDDYDHEFHHEGRAVMPLASADAHGHVVYVGTFSKIVAPGLRVGFVVAPEPVIARLAQWRRAVDRQGDLTVETALAELLEEGALQAHARRMQKVYGQRRTALRDALGAHLAGVVEAHPTAGGMALWAEVSPKYDVERWSAASAEAGVIFATARRFAFDQRPRPFVRLGFAPLDPGELVACVKTMKRCLNEARV